MMKKNEFLKQLASFTKNKQDINIDAEYFFHWSTLTEKMIKRGMYFLENKGVTNSYNISCLIPWHVYYDCEFARRFFPQNEVSVREVKMKRGDGLKKFFLDRDVRNCIAAIAEEEFKKVPKVRLLQYILGGVIKQNPKKTNLNPTAYQNEEYLKEQSKYETPKGKDSFKRYEILQKSEKGNPKMGVYIWRGDSCCIKFDRSLISYSILARTLKDIFDEDIPIKLSRLNINNNSHVIKLPVSIINTISGVQALNHLRNAFDTRYAIYKQEERKHYKRVNEILEKKKKRGESCLTEEERTIISGSLLYRVPKGEPKKRVGTSEQFKQRIRLEYGVFDSFIEAFNIKYGVNDSLKETIAENSLQRIDNNYEDLRMPAQSTPQQGYQIQEAYPDADTVEDASQRGQEDGMRIKEEAADAIQVTILDTQMSMLQQKKEKDGREFNEKEKEEYSKAVTYKENLLSTNPHWVSPPSPLSQINDPKLLPNEKNLSNIQEVKNAYEQSQNTLPVQINLCGLNYQKIDGDGSCLYSAVCLYVGQEQGILRNIVTAHIEHNRRDIEPFFIEQNRNLDDYLVSVAEGREWADHIEIEVLMRVLNRPIVIIDQTTGNIRQGMELHRFTGEPIFVLYNGHNHYDTLLLDETHTGREIFNNLNIPVAEKQGVIRTTLTEAPGAETNLKEQEYGAHVKKEAADAIQVTILDTQMSMLQQKKEKDGREFNEKEKEEYSKAVTYKENLLSTNPHWVAPPSPKISSNKRMFFSQRSQNSENLEEKLTSEQFFETKQTP